MAYDVNFYKFYEAYLNEFIVRKEHGKIFNITAKNPNYKKVIDLGCGLSEFFRFSDPRPEKYVGFDLNLETSSDSKNNKYIIQADYRDIKAIKPYIKQHAPTAFISLFSSEIMPWKHYDTLDEYPDSIVDKNYRYYEFLFKEFSCINAGLVAGFYYKSKIHENPVSETGKIVSYQTLESIDYVESQVFSERRISLFVPSSFGKDVHEVWKFFERK